MKKTCVDLVFRNLVEPLQYIVVISFTSECASLVFVLLATVLFLQLLFIALGDWRLLLLNSDLFILDLVSHCYLLATSNAYSSLVLWLLLHLFQLFRTDIIYDDILMCPVKCRLSSSYLTKLTTLHSLQCLCCCNSHRMFPNEFYIVGII